MIKYKLLNLLYKFIRPWYFAYKGFTNINSNEDFICGYCEKPLLRRMLYCSSYCYIADMAKQMEPIDEEDYILPKSRGDICD
jgi:hypothetical protein